MNTLYHTIGILALDVVWAMYYNICMSVKDSVRRTKFRMKHDFFTIENIVLMLAIIMCLVWTYQSIVAMSRNWELSERLMAEQKDLELVKTEVEAAELENEYQSTSEYQEIMARKYLDKQWPGEHMVVLPDNTEDAKEKHKITPSEAVRKEYSNFEKWMMYLFPTH